MSLAVTERTKDTEHDPVVEFREGVELLKNEYPEKALVRLRRAFESDKRNPYYISFLGLSIARAEQKWDQASELCESAEQLKRKEIKISLESRTGICIGWTTRQGITYPGRRREIIRQRRTIEACTQ
jgi:hypothetical protein